MSDNRHGTAFSDYLFFFLRFSSLELRFGSPKLMKIKLCQSSKNRYRHIMNNANIYLRASRTRTHPVSRQVYFS